MTTPTSKLRRRLVACGVVTAGAVVATAAPAGAERELFFEQTTRAFWEVPHVCADGATVPGTLLVETTRLFEAPDTEDANPTARLQFLAVCPDGISFRWAASVSGVALTSAENLKSVSAAGAGTAVDFSGGTHPVSFDVAWTAVGPIQTTVNVPGSKRKERAATATGQVVFDGAVLADGPANHPTREAPFIRVDTEK
jgi:hypothetical protein